ncbi:hypothetical protein L0B53_18700 (plasmid) [Vibrio sp. SS-MA-C1-2]|uniref:hypothetical protein n=1 Tax=Vibrio sp. SS-MA-C1-2 TaxID=2908646 RepID=UPI001F1EE164|nr:hypothetical protein [Vibrio sp. SS-MA-C1-2]UJF20351.1 hypothetical protein L0B53_18700 [Vibrio sp. SS-MA-C1-2]
MSNNDKPENDKPEVVTELPDDLLTIARTKPFEEQVEEINQHERREKLAHLSSSSSKSVNEDKEKVINNAGTRKMRTKMNPIHILMVVWLGVVSFLQIHMYKKLEAITVPPTIDKALSSIVVYPYSEIADDLMKKGFSFSQIETYNRNMIRILNTQGKVVLSGGAIDGDVPLNWKAPVLTVDEMNALATSINKE